MAKFDVVFTVDASVVVSVEAESLEQAKNKAWEEVGAPTICHQCARKLQTGDVLDLVDAYEAAQ